MSLKSSPVYATPIGGITAQSSQDYMKIMSLDESIDAHESQQMREVVVKQGQLERVKLPQTTDELEAIAAEPGFAMEFLKNIKYMQKCMNQLMDHQVVEERRYFIRQLKSRKLLASIISQLTSAACFVDVIIMMQSDCKAIIDVMDKMGDKVSQVDEEVMTGGQWGLIALGIILLCVQLFSTILVACSHRT